ncbi:hypothetical protein [Methylobacterium tarhaniae]|uniref:hypothetical protein n=1 Tax=Methylobacterium tarhaniae TaxID=1187852 RepID=UPI003CFE4256
MSVSLKLRGAVLSPPAPSRKKNDDGTGFVAGHDATAKGTPLHRTAKSPGFGPGLAEELGRAAQGRRGAQIRLGR